MKCVMVDRNQNQFVIKEFIDVCVDSCEQCEGYFVGFDQVGTPEKFLGLIWHLSEKVWVSCDLLKDLIASYANVFSVNVKLDCPTISSPINLIGWIDRNVNKIGLAKLTEVIDSYRERFSIPYFE